MNPRSRIATDSNLSARLLLDSGDTFGMKLNNTLTPPTNPLQQLFHSTIRDLIIYELSKSNVTKKFLKVFLSPGENSKIGGSKLDQKIHQFATAANELVHSAKSNQLYEMLWINAINCFKTHVKIYRLSRAEVEQQFNKEFDKEESHRHLDEFNEFSIESEDDQMKWSQKLDKIHNLIVLRLQASGLLHSAAYKGMEDELQHLRLSFQKLLALCEIVNISTSPSILVRIVIREWCTCKGLYPIIQKISHPNTLNRYILDKANRRLVVQKAVRFFRGVLDSEHSLFPPAFLISNYIPQKFTLSDKQKYMEVIGKYSKRATSLIDINAVRDEIVKELKNHDKENDHQDEQELKYINTCQLTLRKLNKRLKALELMSQNNSIRSSILLKDNSNSMKASKLELSLETILEKYYNSAEEQGDMHSTSLFYFLDFLEKKKSVNSLHLLRFWAATEKYKRLVCRIGTGIVSDGIGVQPLTDASHHRLQIEVQKIYETFILQGNLIRFSPLLIEAYERYILPLSKTGSKFYSDDYKCVLKTQVRIKEELDKVFEEFQHSNSFFQWSSEMQTSKVIKNEVSNGNIPADRHKGDWLETFEGSALMNSLEDALFDACGKVTGSQIQRDDREKELLSRNIGNEGGIITLEDIIIERNSSIADLLDSTSPMKDDADEYLDLHTPGEFATTSSKILGIKEAINSIFRQIECLNLLQKKVNLSKNENDPVYIMQCHILDETKDLLGNDIGDLTKQKVKLESQEQRKALMPGQCFVTIQEIDEQEDEDSLKKKITFYLITIEQRHLRTGWTVKRRYSDFDVLHQKLKEDFEIVNDFDLPGKTLGLLFPTKSRTEIRANRMKALEKYLQRLIDNKDISKSEHVRNFLSATYRPEKKKIFKSPFEFTNENETLRKTQQKLAKKLSQFDKKAREPISKMMSFLEPLKRKGHSDVEEEEEPYYSKPLSNSSQVNGHLSSQLADGDSSDDNSIMEDGNEEGLRTNYNPLVQSLIQLLVEVFDFKEQYAWLRDNAALVVLHNFLGNKSSVETATSQFIRSYIADDNLIRTIKKYQDYFEHFSLSQATPVGNDYKLRLETKTNVLSLYTASQSKILGGDASFQGHLRLVEMLQNETLNKHLLYSILDSSIELIIEYMSE